MHMVSSTADVVEGMYLSLIHILLAQLGQRLEQTLAPETLYPTIVETVAHALRLPYVALQVGGGERRPLAATYGQPVADPVTLPLTCLLYTSRLGAGVVSTPPGAGPGRLRPRPGAGPAGDRSCALA